MGVSYTTIAGSFSLIPAPLVNITKSYIRDEQGLKLRPEYTITLDGEIVNVGINLDSPGALVDNMDANGASMMGILSEQQRIREMFSIDGGRLTIATPINQSTYDLDFYCQVKDIDFTPSTWTYKCDYKITLMAVVLGLDNETYQELDSSSDNWNITENQDGTYSISHQLQATGALVYTSGAMNNPLSAAREWISERKYSISTSGILSIPNGEFDFSESLTYIDETLPGLDILRLQTLTLDQLQFLLINPTSGNFWNYFVVEGIGWNNRTWKLDESWIYYPSGSVREIYSANVQYENNDFRHVNVTINGDIFGYADKLSNLQLRNQRAAQYYNINVAPNFYMRASGFAPSGYNLSPVPIVKSVTYDQADGVVRYSASMIASSGNIIPNSIDESITINDIASKDIFATINIPNRVQGSLVQYMNTKTLPERTININATIINNLTPLTPATIRGVYLSKPNTDAIIAALSPESGYYYILSDNEEWSITKKVYSRSTSWTIDTQGIAVSGIPTAIHKTQSS